MLIIITHIYPEQLGRKMRTGHHQLGCRCLAVNKIPKGIKYTVHIISDMWKEKRGSLKKMVETAGISSERGKLQMWYYGVGIYNKKAAQSSPGWTLHFECRPVILCLFTCHYEHLSTKTMKPGCNAFLKRIKMWSNPEKKTYPRFMQTNPWWKGKGNPHT